MLRVGPSHLCVKLRSQALGSPGFRVCCDSKQILRQLSFRKGVSEAENGPRVDNETLEKFYVDTYPSKCSFLSVL